MRNRTILGWLGVAGLVLVGTGALVFLTRDTLSKRLIEAWDTQAEKTEARLFRWGELMSISSALKDQYGAEPDVTYDTSTSVRTLCIGFSNYRLPEQVTTERHAREIATFAIGKTTKLKQIDAVRVSFQNSGGSGSFTFALDDLLPNRPLASGVDPDHAVAR